MRRHNGAAEQPSLFAPGELHIPDSLTHFKKPLAVLHAAPTKAEHAQSLNSRRLFDACILVAQLDFRKRDRQQLARLREERSSPLFEVSIGDLARLANIPGKNYERIYNDLDRLFEMVLNWNLVGEDDSAEWEFKSHFLSSIGYGKGRHKGQIRFSIEPSILQMVLEPTIWAQLSLQAMEGLNTAASYALYQNCWRYIGTHSKVTAALPTHTWVELLVGPSRFVKVDPDGTKWVDGYADFKRRILLDAIRRVNESPALNHTLQLVEHSKGNRKVRLQFKFIPKEQASLGLPLTWSDELLRTLKGIGFSDAEIENMSAAHSNEVVIEALSRLKGAEQRLKDAGKPITSHKAYFSGILANMVDGASDLDDDKLAEAAKVAEEQRRAAERSERLKMDFSRHQNETLGGRLFEMPAERRQEILDAMAQSEKGPDFKRLLELKELTPKSIGPLTLLRAWLTKDRPELLAELLNRPEDQGFDAWLMWRLEAAQRPEAEPPAGES